MNVSGQVTLGVAMKDSLDATGGRSTPYAVPVNVTTAVTYSDGTGPGQAHRQYQGGGTAAASPASIDLTAVVNADGTTGLANVVELIVWNNSPTAGQDLKVVGASGSNNAFAPFLGGTSPTLSIPPGTFGRFACPLSAPAWPTSSSARLLILDPGSASIPYQVAAWGY